jgi:hypothetical protein
LVSVRAGSTGVAAEAVAVVSVPVAAFSMVVVPVAEAGSPSAGAVGRGRRVTPRKYDRTRSCSFG